MVMKVQRNNKQDSIYECPCIKCIVKTRHKVLFSIDVQGNEDDYYWDTSYQIIQCEGCHEISFRQEEINSEDLIPIDNSSDAEHIVYESLFPLRLENYKGIDTISLPYPINRIYKETLNAILSDSRVLAGIGLRALLEAISKEHGATGKNLYEKIDDFVNKQLVTPSNKELLHEIRLLGNDAAHEMIIHSKEKLLLAMRVIEILLTNVYVLPKQMKEIFK